jgi:prepilin-type N-terminal cleavage/methylation domain-containing protein
MKPPPVLTIVRRRAFTLIELLVVIAIIAIL